MGATVWSTNWAAMAFACWSSLLNYLKSLTMVKKESTKVAKRKPYKVIPVSPEISRWSGCASLTEKEVEGATHLKAKALLSR